MLVRIQRRGLVHVDDSLVSRLSTRVIASAVSLGAFDAGQQYYRQKRVMSVSCQFHPNGDTTIHSTVRGKGWAPYRVAVALEETLDGLLEIDGECSCPIGHNCKHVAATLFAAVALPSSRPMLPAFAPAGSAAPPAPDTLSSPLASWIDELARVEETDGEDYPPEITQRLVYLLDVERSPRGPRRLAVSPVSTRVLKSGGYSVTTQPYNPAAALNPMAAKFLRPSDRAILRRLELSWRSGYPSGPSNRALAGEEGSAILEAIIATGRAQWKALGGPAVTLGPPRNAELNWRLGDDAALHPEFRVVGDDQLQVVVLAPPWYVDAEAGVVGPLETGLGPRLAEALLSAPPVPAEQSAPLRKAIDARLPALAALRPPELAPPGQVSGPPVPRLTLTTATRHQPYTWMGPQTMQVPVARLAFRYGAAEIGEHDDRLRPLTVQAGRVLEVLRDGRREREVKNLLRTAGFDRLSKHSPYGLAPGQRDDFMFADGPDRHDNWLDFLYNGVPAFQRAGWEVVVDPAFPIRLTRADGPLEAEMREGSGIDWLELDLGVFIDGERFELTPSLLKLISDPSFDATSLAEPPDENEAIYLGLPDGRVLALPARRVWRMVCTLHELFNAGMFGRKDTALRFSPFDAAALAGAEAATSDEGVVWRGGERLRQLGEMLRAADGIPHVEIPASFNATLRPYQASGVDWLQFLRGAGLGAVLADDMGLGKTVQTLAHLVIEKESGRLDRPALIVSPTSVVPNWRQEAARFAPDLKVLVLHGPARQERFGEIAAHDLVITTYPLLIRDRETLAAHEWHLVVLDEAQAIKNPAAVAARMVRELNARQRLCLTGTPVENHLGELWSLFSFLSPGFLGDRAHFNRNWRRPIEVEGNDDRRRQLARRVRPFLLRRTKADVASELPAKTEIIESVEMDTAQRDVYETVRLAMHGRVREAIAAKGLARSHIILLDALLKMRQACCDPRLLKLNSAKAMRARSAKFDRLMEMLPELLAEGRRILLFSQFTSMLALIEEGLREAGIRYMLLTGDTRDRETPVRAFQAGEVPLFLISLKAGGVGLNLTAADTVIHYDPWWNPAVEEQATDRAHRIGQAKSVFVYRLITLGSIEEKMEELKERKRGLAAGIFDPDSGSTLELSESDIEELFAPA